MGLWDCFKVLTCNHRHISDATTDFDKFSVGAAVPLLMSFADEYRRNVPGRTLPPWGMRTTMGLITSWLASGKSSRNHSEFMVKPLAST